MIAKPAATGERPDVTASANQPVENEKQWSRKDVLRDVRFYLVFPAMLSSPYILTGFFFHQASLASERGLSMEVVAGFFGAFALAKIVGSLVYGPLVDKVGPVRAILIRSSDLQSLFTRLGSSERQAQ